MQLQSRVVQVRFIWLLLVLEATIQEQYLRAWLSLGGDPNCSQVNHEPTPWQESSLVLPDWFDGVGQEDITAQMPTENWILQNEFLGPGAAHL